jgi:DME family drug/metabolite transporter
VAAGLLWGTGGLTGRLLERSSGLPALSVAAYRLATGGALIIVFLVLTGRRWPAGRPAWTRITMIAGLAAVFQGCYFTAVSLTSVSVATLVTIGSAPVLVLAAQRVRGQRRISRLAGCATGLALTGLGLLVGLPSGGFAETAVLASTGLAVVAGAGFATLTLVSARPVPGLDDLAATGFGFTLGGLVLLPVAAAFGGIGFTPGPVTLGLLAALGTAPTAVAYTLYFRGLRTAPAGIAALLSLLEPLTGTVLAALILGDRLGPTGIAGAVILAMALILAAVGGRGAASQGTVAGRGAASGHGPADHGRGPAQHDHAQRDEHGERLPHGRAGKGARRQDPGGGNRVVERVEVGQHPHPLRPE